MPRAPRFLVIDGYNCEAREELKAGGASAAGDLYVGMLRRCLPGAECDVIHPADPGTALPKGAALQQYDG
ncbi:MAG: type 1 glutamine amidotransferase, partial [Woeseiaceae bacterium]